MLEPVWLREVKADDVLRAPVDWRLAWRASSSAEVDSSAADWEEEYRMEVELERKVDESKKVDWADEEGYCEADSTDESSVVEAPSRICAKDEFPADRSEREVTAVETSED